jgi:hypothetical protein
MHRYAQPAAGATLVARGWTAGAVAFHALPSPGTPDDPGLQPGTDTTFSFAVMPDTQDEVGATDPKMPKRVDWLLGHRDALDLRWVLHSGDVQSWDTADHVQYVRMSSRLERLAANGLPFVATPGNHDTGAVCPGGSACPGADTRVGLRDTRTWNTYYPPGRFGFEGLYEPGKSDNGWRTFQAGGLNWLVLSVEPWPRTGVVAWARQVVASHPHHNVILLTHAFLDASGRIAEDNADAGRATSLGPTGTSLRATTSRDIAVMGAREPLVLDDPVLGPLEISAEGFSDRVVWNPGPGHGLADVPEGGERDFVCIEAAELTAVTVQPGDTWRGRQTLRSSPR